MATVERIKLTSNRIIAISRSSSTTFDTDKLYLKTDPAGLFKIGGYQPTPGIWGINSNILNHDDMWFPSRIIDTWYASSSYGGGGVSYNDWMSFSQTEATFGKIPIPKCTQAKIVQVPFTSVRFGVGYPTFETSDNWCYGPTQYVQLNGKNTSIQFRWIATTCRGLIGSVTTYPTPSGRKAAVAPYLLNATSLPPSKNASGYYRFPAPGPYFPTDGNSWNPAGAFGELLVTPAGTKLKDWVYVVGGGSYLLVNSHPWCVMTQLLPVNLSVGLTA